MQQNVAHIQRGRYYKISKPDNTIPPQDTVIFYGKVTALHPMRFYHDGRLVLGYAILKPAKIHIGNDTQLQQETTVYIYGPNEPVFEEISPNVFSQTMPETPLPNNMNLAGGKRKKKSRKVSLRKKRNSYKINKFKK